MGTVKWFGRRWDSPMTDEAPQVPPPVGEECLGCGEPIGAEDSGITMPYYDGAGVREAPFHLECQLRSILGSMAHQEGRCTCFGGTEHDDFTRAGARAVMERLVAAGGGGFAG